MTANVEAAGLAPDASAAALAVDVRIGAASASKNTAPQWLRRSQRPADVFSHALSRCSCANAATSAMRDVTALATSSQPFSGLACAGSEPIRPSG